HFEIHPNLRRLARLQIAHEGLPCAIHDERPIFGVEHMVTKREILRGPPGLGGAVADFELDVHCMAGQLGTRVEIGGAHEYNHAGSRSSTCAVLRPAHYLPSPPRPVSRRYLSSM